MAVGTNFHVDIPCRGARLDDVAARASDRGGLIFGMDAGFHKFLSNGVFIT
jgi:hypothetical protein